MVQPNDNAIPSSKVRICYEYLKSLGQPYSYKDDLEVSRAFLLYPQYLQGGEGWSSTNPLNLLAICLMQTNWAKFLMLPQRKLFDFSGPLVLREVWKIELNLSRRKDNLLLEGDGIDSKDESYPPFVCDRDVTTNLELHTSPNLEDVQWADEQVCGICSVLTPPILNLLTPPNV